MSFPTLHTHVVAAQFRFASPSFTTAHIHPLPFIRCNTLHSFTPASPCFSQRSTFKQKNAPNWLPAAPCHRAPRFPCQGHSLNSHRLAHNAQASYFVSFLFTRISALLSTHAQGCFYIRFKPASPTPTPDHPPLNILQLQFLSPSGRF